MWKNAVCHNRVGNYGLSSVRNRCLKCLWSVNWQSDRGSRNWRSQRRSKRNLWCAKNLLRWLWRVSKCYRSPAHVLGCRNNLRLRCRHRDDRSRDLNRSHRSTDDLTLALTLLLGLRVGHRHWVDNAWYLNCRHAELSVLIHEILVRCSQLCNLQFIRLHTTL